MAAPSPSIESLAARRVALGFVALAGVTYVLLVFGALVRANGAGLACPDWPCFGEVILAFDVGVAFEWGYRALAGSVGFVFLGLGIATLRLPNLGRAMRGGLAVAAMLLAVQVVLGGLTVLELLARWTVTSIRTGTRSRSRSCSRAAALPPLRQPRARASADASSARSSRSRRLLVAQIVLGGLVSSSYAGPSVRTGRPA